MKRPYDTVNPLRMRAAATAAMLGIMFGGGPARIVGKRQRAMTWSRSHQGSQEMARRQRQIERGQLTKSNGLVTP